MSEYPVYIVDAFTDIPFSGNPAGVYLCPTSLNEQQMQLIARELNLSETAFPIPTSSEYYTDANRFHLRWFSPLVEVPLCGHATLATAHVLWSELQNENDTLAFETKSGRLEVHRGTSGYVMDFPRGKAESIPITEDITCALELSIESVVDMLYCEDPNKLLIVVKDETDVKDLQPDFLELSRISEKHNAGSIIVTTISTSTEYDFISRNFAPIRGVNEDSVTGSSHVILGPYWQAALKKDTLVAYQASSRGGSMTVKMVNEDRVLLIGNAVTITRGTMTIPVRY